MIENDLAVGGGRVLRVYDTGPADLPVVWLHGTPNLGEPPEPLLPAAAARGIRWIGYDRPGYGSSTPRPGRDVGSAADDVRLIADALGIERFAVMGHSGGASHALACAARLPDRVIAAACLATIAPRPEIADWYAGMAPSGAARLRAAAAGRAALTAHLASAEFDPDEFTVADHAALSGRWSWFGTVAGKAEAGPADGMLDDELAYVAPWGFDPADVTVPVLFVHGGEDRIAPRAHGEWLAGRCPTAQLWLRPDDGHLSVMAVGEAVLDWLRANAGPTGPVLRPARPEDADAIAAIWYHGWRDGHLGHVPDELVAARTKESFWERAPQRIGDTTVATVDGAVAGFVMVVGDEVEQVYVAAEHRGTGVAGVLLAEAERVVAAGGHGRAWLAVATGNARARRFYERHGWVDEGPMDYPAASAQGPVRVPVRRYAKPVIGAL
ncbi:MAG TPA: alpha/beta fold hydrolase [Natronosporangium sp.]